MRSPMHPSLASQRRVPARARGAFVLLIASLAAGPAVQAGGLSPQDMASMMQGMMGMMKLWNAFTSGGDFDFQGAFSPGSAFSGSSWSDPWGSAPWSSTPWTAMPGASMPGMSAPWTSMPGASMPGMSAPWASMPGASVPGMSPPWASMPWGAPGMPPAYAPRAGSAAPHGPSSPLEGRWQGTSGEWLEFRGDRFRLGASEKGQVSGTFLIHGSRLVAYVREADVTRMYQFERKGDYLALQDESGEVLLFRLAR